MKYSYYRRLSKTDQAIYRRSDEITSIELPGIARFGPLVRALKRALESEHQPDVEQVAFRLCMAVTHTLGVESVRVRVRARRPSSAGSELHGLYTREEGKPALIEVWMRTVAQRRVVAFRTFLRTLLHELCHHLDFVHFNMRETFHTQGFFRRESSLTRQMLYALDALEADAGTEHALREPANTTPAASKPQPIDPTAKPAYFARTNRRASPITSTRASAARNDLALRKEGKSNG